MGLPDPARSRAVLIGVDGYRFLPDLPAVRNNIDTLAALLMDPAVWGLPPDHCVVLHNPVSNEIVLDAVHEAACTAQDAFLVYFAGHGLLSPSADLCLGLPESHPERLFKAVSYDWLRHELVDTCAAPSRVVILDCCYSGRALEGHMGTPEEVAARAAVEGTYLMTASAETKLAWAPVGEPFTAFTGELVKALGEGVPDAPALLEMETLFRHMRRELTAKQRPVPQQLARNAGHGITLFRNQWDPGSGRAARPRLAPAPLPRPAGDQKSERRRFGKLFKSPRVLAAGVAVAVALALPFLPLPPFRGWPGEGTEDRRPNASSPVATPGSSGGASVIGDRRTVDPCALMDAPALARYGTARVDRDYGNFNRCDVLIETVDGETVDVMVFFDNGGKAKLPPPKRTVGGVGVVDVPDDSDNCGQTLLPPGDDGVNITVIAKQRKGSAPLCAIAETATDSAIAVLNQGRIARRSPEFAEASLAHVDACALLTLDRLAGFLGAGVKISDANYGNWGCNWRSTSSELRVGVRFDRDQSPTADEGFLTQIEGRDAVVQPDGEGPDTCLIRVVHLTYNDQNGSLAVETLNLTVGGDLGEDRLRRMATELVTAAVGELPDRPA
ncbi:caspase family protein [Streptomyces sp. NPDC020965]|uniref:caspase, EACC1-associated type n=1 Tax=Streptomyces sp. NPDC020965 TaxID=3365105 RepID=UPI0037BBE0AB